jgi:hypothetical protein
VKSLAVLPVYRYEGLKPLCESACKKDPVFGVIGIQTGPRG